MPGIEAVNSSSVRHSDPRPTRWSVGLNNNSNNNNNNNNSKCGPKRDENRERRRLHNELHSFYLSPNIVRVIKSRRLKWARHLTRIEEDRSAFKILISKKPIGSPRQRGQY